MVTQVSAAEHRGADRQLIGGAVVDQMQPAEGAWLHLRIQLLHTVPQTCAGIQPQDPGALSAQTVGQIIQRSATAADHIQLIVWFRGVATACDQPIAGQRVGGSIPWPWIIKANGAGDLQWCPELPLHQQGLQALGPGDQKRQRPIRTDWR